MNKCLQPCQNFCVALHLKSIHLLINGHCLLITDKAAFIHVEEKSPTPFVVPASFTNGEKFAISKSVHD